MLAEKLILVVGVSGSGKSTALNAMEDEGYFCVENIPAPLVMSIVDALVKSTKKQNENKTDSANKASHFALLVDCRDEHLFSYVEDAISKLRQAGTKVEILYLDCDDDVVIRRFRETRRPHPLMLDDATGRTLVEAINKEREIISRFRAIADKIIDTSNHSPHELRKVIEDYIGADPQTLEITLRSFGFKYGVPQDSDLVIDVRFLPNPHYIPKLRPLTGKDQEVSDYVMKHDDAIKFLSKYVELLRFLIPRYIAEGKRYLTISIGCTGGQHRSVALTEQIASQLKLDGNNVVISHRDMIRNAKLVS